jgi:lipoprotein-anchoring transpeptidase ErfK/SrfK
VSTSDPSLQLSRPSRLLRLRPRPRVAVGLAVALFAVLALVGSGAGLGVYHDQQARLTQARADRAAAKKVVDAAVLRAQGDGITGPELAPVLSAEAALLSGSPIAPHFGWFDNGEIGRLRHQAAGLRSLVGRIDAIQVAATGGARGRVAALLSQLDAAIAAAQSVGLDASADATFLAGVRESVARAATPTAVDASVASVRQHLTDLGQRTDAKRAADAALAALNASQARAQGAVARADGLVAQAGRFPQLQIQQWADVIAAVHPQLAAATTQDQFDAVTAAVTPPANSIAALLSARSSAYSAMSDARQAVQTAISYKIDPGPVPSQLDSLQSQLDTTGTEPGFGSIANQAGTLVAPLEAKVVTASLGVGKVILISLKDQELAAYQDGATILTTPVTTGRPALPTPTGNFQVLRKSHPWVMRSDFPRWSPYWYPDSPVTYVLWFTNAGHGIHDAPWRATYGPGTQAGGSHGCVNVPFAAEKILFNWADVGTRVVIRAESLNAPPPAQSSPAAQPSSPAPAPSGH